ncbi:MAG: hypothetical protein R2758_00910 [Bacteroidales bacterium]
MLTHGGEEPEDELKALAGFALTDTSGLTGTIAEVVQHPGQLMAVAVIPKGDEVLIPLHPDLVLSVNAGDKTITMTLPEGLISLND